MIRAFEWKRLFWTERARFLEHLRVFVIGHAAAEKLMAPYIGLTAHALLLPVGPPFTRSALSVQLAEVDGLAAQLVRTAPAFDSPRNLSPLPLLGVPGWSRESALEAFYDDAAYFRSGRRARPPHAGALYRRLREPMLAAFDERATIASRLKRGLTAGMAREIRSAASGALYPDVCGSSARRVELAPVASI